MTKRAALYLRVSTDGQTTENQRRELENVAARSGWTIVGVYEDAGVSGAKGRDKRPAFDKLCKDAARRKFDVVMAWAIDRLGRSVAGGRKLGSNACGQRAGRDGCQLGSCLRGAHQAASSMTQS